ncbi:MAG: PDZ domain-containing protein, partial [Candidatus Paceibacterota bacterium]
AVVKNSPADEVGIKEGDIILKWNGEKVTVDKDIQDQLSDHGVGDEIELEIYREGETFNKKAKLAERK